MFEQTAPIWMGIVNLTKDSFSDGAEDKSLHQIKKNCENLIQQGAQILDFGAVASNPSVSSFTITPIEEFKILKKNILAIQDILPQNVFISVDTFSPQVAYWLAQENLIHIINDIYASQKLDLINNLQMTTAHVAAKFNLGLILMHMPERISKQTERSFFEDLKNFLSRRLQICKDIGVKQIAIDPGIGYGRFGKTLEEIQFILKKTSIQELNSLGAPLLIGLSRKTFLRVLRPELIEPSSRDHFSKELEWNCLNYGAKIIRTHQINLEKI